ncbi:MAG: hypothetical protein GX237_03415 [Clostridiales bacterium]|nr:hypothetical protein [Clostridiales bacterium]
MAKNKRSKQNNYKGTSKNSPRYSNSNQSRNSTKNTHAEVPDDSPGRSGPGGE